jgi:hypothetical protein
VGQRQGEQVVGELDAEGGQQRRPIDDGPARATSRYGGPADQGAPAVRPG